MILASRVIYLMPFWEYRKEQQATRAQGVKKGHISMLFWNWSLLMKQITKIQIPDLSKSWLLWSHLVLNVTTYNLMLDSGLKELKHLLS